MLRPTTLGDDVLGQAARNACFILSDMLRFVGGIPTLEILRIAN